MEIVYTSELNKKLKEDDNCFMVFGKNAFKRLRRILELDVGDNEAMITIDWKNFDSSV